MIVPRTEVDRDAVAAHYDQLDRFYREIWGEHVHHGLWTTGQESPEEAVRALTALVADRAGIAPGNSVCDIGCGYGGTARLLARDFGATVTALSVSPVQLNHARGVDPSAENPEYVLGDWLANDLPDASFDAAIAIESSEHMADKAGFFAQARRVLKPGGRLVVCAWLATPRPRKWEVRHLLEPICREGRLPGMGSADEYLELAREAGLEPSGVEDLSQQVKKTWPLCAWRTIKGLARDRSYRRFLLSPENPDRIFALTLFRIWMAYETGSMRYGLMTATRPIEASESLALAGEESARR